MNLRIRVLREENGLCQRNLAEYLGCTQQTYSRYETGELEPSLGVMEKLARFYNTSVDYIMGLTDDRSAKSRASIVNSTLESEFNQRCKIAWSIPKLKRGRKPKNQSVE